MAYHTLMGEFKYIQIMKYTYQPGQVITIHKIPTINGVTRYGVILIGGGRGAGNKHDEQPPSGSCFYDTIDSGTATTLEFRVGKGGAGAATGNTQQVYGNQGVQTTLTYGNTVIQATGGGVSQPTGVITDSRYGFKQSLVGITAEDYNFTITGPGGSQYKYYANMAPVNNVPGTPGADGLLYGQSGQPPGVFTSATNDTSGGDGAHGLAILFWNDPGVGPIMSNVYYNDNNAVQKAVDLYYNDNNVIRKATELWYNNNGNMVQVYGAKPGLANNEFLINDYVMGFSNEYGYENNLFGDSGTANGVPVQYHRIKERSGVYTAQLGLQTFGQIPNTTSKFVYTAKDNTWVSITYEWKNGHYLSTTVTSSDYQWFRTHNNQVVTVRYNG